MVGAVIADCTCTVITMESVQQSGLSTTAANQKIIEAIEDVLEHKRERKRHRRAKESSLVQRFMGEQISSVTFSVLLLMFLAFVWAMDEQLAETEGPKFNLSDFSAEGQAQGSGQQTQNVGSENRFPLSCNMYCVVKLDSRFFCN